MRMALLVVAGTAVVYGQWLIAIPLAVWYAVWFRGYALIAIAFVIDGYTYAFYDLPWITIGALLLVVAVETIKPWIRNTKV